MPVTVRLANGNCAKGLNIVVKTPEKPMFLHPNYSFHTIIYNSSVLALLKSILDNLKKLVVNISLGQGNCLGKNV